MRILISGGGVGGLAAAQGLLGAGHEVVVLERGALPTGPSGYRLRLDTRAVRALRALLPGPVGNALLASGAGSAVNRSLTYLDHRLRPLGRAPEDDQDVLMIGRGPLLRLLSHGITAHVREHRQARHFEVTDTGVEVTTADGHVEAGDLLVVAEGVRSPLRAQLLGDDGVRPLGVGAISGRIAGTSTGHGLHAIAEALTDGYALCSGPHGVGLFLSHHDPTAGPSIDPRAIPAGDVAPDLEDPYLTWGLVGPDAALPAAGTDDDTLRRAVEELTDGWHDDVGRLAALAEPGSRQRYDLQAAPPVPTWPTTAVTLLGDAVHVVPPTGGVGASTSIRDAGHLVDALRDVTDRSAALAGLHRYEQTMRGYADTVVEDSVAPLRWQQRLTRPAVHATVTGALAHARPLARLLGSSA